MCKEKLVEKVCAVNTVYIYTLVFFTTLVVCRYVMSNCRMILNNSLIRFERKRSWSDRVTVPAFAWKGRKHINRDTLSWSRFDPRTPPPDYKSRALPLHWPAPYTLMLLCLSLEIVRTVSLFWKTEMRFRSSPCCLPIRCVATALCSISTFPASRHHVTLHSRVFGHDVFCAVRVVSNTQYVVKGKWGMWWKGPVSELVTSRLTPSRGGVASSFQATARIE